MNGKKDKYELYLDNFKKSFHNLSTSLHEKDQNEFVQDASIKRFELAYELAWKCIKAHLEFLGIFCASPRDCFKQAKSNGIIKDELGWLSMIETRNTLVHTYNAQKSRELLGKIKMEHLKLFEELLAYFENT